MRRLTGGASRYLRSDPLDRHGATSTVSGDALWWPPSKIAGRYLGPFLAGRDGFELHAPPEDPGALQIEIDLPAQTA